ncbi:MAG: hypothetical protein J6X50_04880 [Bacilli bacterium]|nr:hypothetical protein [Bacilli bacterium]
MFEINEAVIHYREGLSTIIGINQLNGVDYFLLRVNKENAETIYVPISSASNIIRPIMNEKEADAVLKYIKGIKKEFNPNTKQRRDSYKRKLSSGEVKEIAFLYKQLGYYYQAGGENNTEIKLGPVDIEMLSTARNILLDELTLSYKVNRQEIDQYIEKRMKKL